MTAKVKSEVRELHKDLIRAEEVCNLLGHLRSKRLGTSKLEFFLRNLFGGKGEQIGSNLRGKQMDREKVVKVMMDVLVKDAQRDAKKTRGKYWHKRAILSDLCRSTSQYRRAIDKISTDNQSYRDMIKAKNKEKIDHLQKKFRPKVQLEPQLSEFGNCNVFQSDQDQDPKVDDHLRDLIEEVI